VEGADLHSNVCLGFGSEFTAHRVATALPIRRCGLQAGVEHGKFAIHQNRLRHVLYDKDVAAQEEPTPHDLTSRDLADITRMNADRKIKAVSISLLLLAPIFLVIWGRVLSRILVFPIFFSMIAVGFWCGRRTYFLFADENSDRPDWGLLILSVVVGFVPVLTLRLLFTHEMVRAFDEMLATGND
jgi:hypothetical protein